MSDHWISLVPEDPRLVPDADRQQRAREYLAKLAPDADEIETVISETIRLFDCGENLERIRCPSCRSDIPTAWWQERMGEDYDDGFKLAWYPAPCCGARVALNELEYEWPVAFGCFALTAMNPNVGRLDDRHTRELESLLGTSLRVVYRMI